MKNYEKKRGENKKCGVKEWTKQEEGKKVRKLATAEKKEGAERC